MNKQLITRDMTPEEWFTVPDCPIQRDTQRHSEKALRTHLNKESSAQWSVQMATLPDGKCYKLDGHSRSLLWEEGKLSAPDIIKVLVHPCRSVEKVLELYTHIDNKKAVEDSPDMVFGAYRLHNISPKSSLLRKCHLKKIMQVLLSREISIYDAIGLWKNEIIAFDKTSPIPGPHFPAGVVSGALATFRKHSEFAPVFWNAYRKDQGFKTSNSRNGVQALREFVQQNRGITNNNVTDAYDMACRVISAFEIWRTKRLYKSIRIGRTDMRDYLNGKRKNVGQGQ